MEITIIGIDCATQSNRVGLARAAMENSRTKVLKAGSGRRGQSVGELANSIADWVPDGGRTLLALDAPLGWPVELGQALFRHAAGAPIDGAANTLFRRTTDRIVKQKLGRQPLDVGADRIARTAHAALALLRELRALTEQTIPLAWNPILDEGISAIEVYPAATLTAHGIRASGYKRVGQEKERVEILDRLGERLVLPGDISCIASNADVLDAVVCVLAAADFVAGEAIRPTDQVLAEKEGWIWVRDPRQVSG